MKHKRSILLYVMAGAVLSALFLVFSSAIQKIIIQAPLGPKGFIISTLFGLASGALLGLYIYRVKQARALAEQANESKRAFLANVSHELRTPLNGIVGIVELLKASSASAKQESYLKVIERSAKRLEHLIHNMLDVSNLDSGEIFFVNRKFNLCHLIDTLLDRVAADIQERKLSLYRDIQFTSQMQLIGDSTKVEQLLQNLLENAIKFTEEGTISLIVRELPGEAGQKRVEFQVRDTGIGVEPQLQKEIFSLFAQAENSYRRRYKGAGLGLTICQRLVQYMGGEIRLESTPGQGSNFIVLLPFQIAETSSIGHA